MNQNDVPNKHLFHTDKEQLQHQLNEWAQEHGVHLGRAEGDWRANHFISMHFGNVADVIKSAKKKSEPRVMSIEATAETRMATAMMILTVTLQSILTTMLQTMLETTIMEGQVFFVTPLTPGFPQKQAEYEDNQVAK
ncbi:hypothetical protein BCR42DRAFT_397379 [Absidia repens]|uniref:Uncharacterized protein n=1 Tax=Absidia repens TaxID=90262 RepID=A0A1X2I142_9FUNG|nr:hypothetical protein BCR42DRAFT_397379 [Absidia repens]